MFSTSLIFMKACMIRICGHVQHGQESNQLSQPNDYHTAPVDHKLLIEFIQQSETLELLFSWKPRT